MYHIVLKLAQNYETMKRERFGHKATCKLNKPETDRVGAPSSSKTSIVKISSILQCRKIPERKPIRLETFSAFLSNWKLKYPTRETFSAEEEL